jgi:hypothetical protein
MNDDAIDQILHAISDARINAEPFKLILGPAVVDALQKMDTCPIDHSQRLFGLPVEEGPIDRDHYGVYVIARKGQKKYITYICLRELIAPKLVTP